MKVKKLSDFINEQSGSDYDEGQIFAGDEDRIIDPTKPLKKRKDILPFEPFRSDWKSKKINDEESNFLYHAIEDDDYDSVMETGLHGDIYLTKTAEEAREYHPFVLKINVKGRKLTVKDEGFVVRDVPVDQIEPVLRFRKENKKKYYGGKIPW